MRSTMTLADRYTKYQLDMDKQYPDEPLMSFEDWAFSDMLDISLPKEIKLINRRLTKRRNRA